MIFPSTVEGGAEEDTRRFFVSPTVKMGETRERLFVSPPVKVGETRPS